MRIEGVVPIADVKNHMIACNVFQGNGPGARVWDVGWNAILDLSDDSVGDSQGL